jgi:hypothetical protein
LKQIAHIETNDSPNGSVPYYTNSMIFTQDFSHDLVSWEIGKNGEVIFRDDIGTTEYLNEERSVLLNYHTKGKGVFDFGDFPLGEDHQTGWMRRITLKYPVKTENELYSSISGFSFLGTDEKGSFYFQRLSVDWEEMRNLKTHFSVIFAIVNPWNQSVYFREVKDTEWNPPRRGGPGFYGSWPMAVHPNGDIYLFDADESKKEYEIKVVRNNWWKEMGVEKISVGQILNNHVELKAELSIKDANNGYVYENDYVWMKSEKEDKDKKIWVNVQKLDGT